MRKNREQRKSQYELPVLERIHILTLAFMSIVAGVLMLSRLTYVAHLFLDERAQFTSESCSR